MSDDSSRFQYNEDLQPLGELLSNVERAGDFFVHDTLELPMPKVEVAEVGVLSFPVPETQIAALIEHAARAPYGRGEETILDTSVRKVWQLPPANVRIGGKSWESSLQAILGRVKSGLSCEGETVTAELYKLLVYDTGGFFLAHRDSEKEDGMFGTLVVALPSAHQGGELVIRHAGREVTVDLSQAEFSELSFVAFYADCEHEVRPITMGNRVCLVYNLIQKRRAQDLRLNAPENAAQIEAAAALLEEALGHSRQTAKIAWLLEHHYSPAGLSFAGLKSSDAAKAAVLVQAAERAGCAAHLAIVHIEESGAAEPNYDTYRPRGWGSYHDDGDDEGEEADSDDFTVVEVSESSQFVSEWRNPRDQAMEFGKLPLAPGELLPFGALDEEEPDEQRLLEASGNAGVSFERAYHRAAIVIWHRARYAEVLLQAGVGAALPYLEERIASCTKRDATPAARQDVTALARKLIHAWRDACGQRSYGMPAPPEKREGMLRLLLTLADATVLEEFIAEVVIPEYDGSENAALVDAAKLLGPSKAGELLAGVVGSHMGRMHGSCVGAARLRPSRRSDRRTRKAQGTAPGRGGRRWATGQSRDAAVGRQVARLGTDAQGPAGRSQARGESARCAGRTRRLRSPRRRRDPVHVAPGGIRSRRHPRARSDPNRRVGRRGATPLGTCRRIHLAPK